MERLPRPSVRSGASDPDGGRPVAGDAGPEVNVGVLISASPTAELEPLRAFAAQLVRDAAGVLADATHARWAFHPEKPFRLPDDNVRLPADFLDEASLRMVEGPYDLVLVVTDVRLISRSRRVEPGLASEISQVAVLSTRQLLVTPRGQPMRTLASPAVRWNAAALALHLLGHLLGLSHHRRPGTVMSPFRFEEARRAAPEFDEPGRRSLQRRVRRLPGRELEGGGVFRTLAFHLSSALRNPGEVLLPVWRSRAPLLPLSLPRLATAAVAPTFILLFTAEIWDVGLNMLDREAGLFGVLSVLGATWYLLRVQNLFFPRKEKRVVTEHMAVVNVSVLLVMLLAMLGLFLLVAVLMLFLATFVFPSDLIRTWPTLGEPNVTAGDKLRLASFISTIGVLTGSLAGGLESRAVLRQLALFRDEP